MTSTRSPHPAPPSTSLGRADRAPGDNPAATSSAERRAHRGSVSGPDARGTTMAGPASSGADSYYGRSILKPPVWRWFIPAYFFTGGLAGTSSALALAAGATGQRSLARRASLVAAAALAVSPPLLIADLGRRTRFYNMLRVAKVTSPMSVGTWVLSASGAAITAAAAAEVLPVPARLRGAAHLAAGGLGLPLATYTGALLADTAVPAWQEARLELPFVFGSGAVASAGGVACMVTRPEDARVARWAAAGGAGLELAASALMEHRLGTLLAEPYRTGVAGRLAKLARLLSAGGLVALVLGGDRRPFAVAGGLLAALGSLVQRFAVHHAGIASAADPRYVVESQRAFLETAGRR